MEKTSEKGLVWDWSIRVFHWLFAGSVSLALGIAFLAGEHSSIFEWHMLFGLSAGFLLLMRLILFLVGSRHVNVHGLLESFRGAPAYIRSFLGNDGQPGGGHNPLAWVVYLFMFGLLAGTVWTGINMDSEWAEDIHEVFAWGLVAMIAAHLLGLVVHTLRFRENVALSMVTGKKRAPEGQGIRSARPIIGVLVLGVSLTFIGQLFAAYQAGVGEIRLPWIQTVVTLGEGEEDEHGEGGERHGSDDEHEYGDDD